MKVIQVGYFRIAVDAASKSLNPEHRVGAVVCQKKPLSVGWNQWFKTNPRVLAAQPGRGKRLHAEMHACQGLADAELRGAHVYVARLTPADTVALARPCPECLQFLSAQGVRKIYYTVSADHYGVLRWRSNNEWKEPI